MTQIARPNSTIENGGWAVIGVPTHHEAVDDEVRDDDSSYVKCVEGNTVLKLGLSSLQEPQVKLDHIATIWAKAIGSGKGESLDGWMYQGATLIGQLYSKKSIGRIDYSYGIRGYLELEEIALITDYSALELHFAYKVIGSGEEIRITMMEFEVPDALAMTYKSPIISMV